MDHYIDIRLRPDPDFPAPILMGALYSKLHRALVELAADDIGISLPAHNTGVQARHPGETLRVHGAADRIETLLATGWLKGMRDHAEVGEVFPVPDNAVHRTVRRRQFKTNADRLRRRRMRRHNESETEVIEAIPESIEKRVTLPFIQVRSSSTGQRFSLFIEHGPKQDTPEQGRFNSYGLSSSATVPWF
ncbi:type I-F CRISPR-associated endoribonuclease Cas6/Csy4 [Salinisphaera hydrothermalis]|uniref:CRISPR-associated protein, Csy4 family n=1 Tax=Salinisphaera hydrothermalis (strain C41B8) TaxID=1304275 RepID=A0A084ILD0_SALHC|nr:type I-F CRISPR-associated endoribonuclease Cas6/Csy4 [Salinisphaera hydrothermalis]KEZ77514.1 CRISPR-associated protein, Csy4 family [Salinisphaera hydrothermalis C41B8]